MIDNYVDYILKNIGNSTDINNPYIRSLLRQNDSIINSALEKNNKLKGVLIPYIRDKKLSILLNEN